MLSKTVRSGFFFFFEFRPKSTVSADMADSGPSQPDSARIGVRRSCVGSRQRASVKTTWDPRGTTRPDPRAAASPARRRVGRECGTSGAVSVLPRLCPPKTT